jgi:hypothetical protein
MKKKARLLFILLLLIVCLSNFYRNDTPAENARLHSFSEYPNNGASPDSIPKIPASQFLKNPNPPAPKEINFIKKFLSAFKFKKNADANERIRVKALIDTMRIDANLEISMKNIVLLDSAFNISKSNIDSLVKEIGLTDAAVKKWDTVHLQMTRDLVRNFLWTNWMDKLQLLSAHPEIDISKELNDLKIKNHPGYNKKLKEDTARAKRIALMDSIRTEADKTNSNCYPFPPINTLDSISEKRKYRLLVKNRAEVYGIYNLATTNNFNSDRVEQLDYLLLNSIPFDGNAVKKKADATAEFINGFPLIAAVQQTGSKVGLTLAVDSNNNAASNALSKDDVKFFVSNLVRLLNNMQAAAVNFNIEQLGIALHQPFISFVQQLYDSLKTKHTEIKILLTILPDQKKNEGLISLLRDAVHISRIIIDFSRIPYKPGPGPVSLLYGKQPSTITSTVNWCKAKQLQMGRIILQLPYRGTIWSVGKNNIPHFLEDIGYAQLSNRYVSDNYSFDFSYPPDSSYAIMKDIINVMDTSVGNKDMIARKAKGLIYFDDDISLGKKYQYILDNKLQGVALDGMGDDLGYSELWDELTYRFAFADTVRLSPEDNIPYPELHWNQRWSMYFSLYCYIADHPCAACFKNMKDTGQLNLYNSYMHSLGIDTLFLQENKIRAAKKEQTFYSRFEFVNHLLERQLAKLALILFLILLVSACFYFLKIKYLGAAWKGKKLTGYLSLIVCFLFVISLFSYMYCAGTLPYFGVRPPGISQYATDQGWKVEMDKITQSVNSTKINRGAVCNDTPLPVLLLFVTIGFILVCLLTNSFIVRRLKRKVFPEERE